MTTTIQQLPTSRIINVVLFPTWCACTNQHVPLGFLGAFVFSRASLTSDVSTLFLDPSCALQFHTLEYVPPCTNSHARQRQGFTLQSARMNASHRVSVRSIRMPSMQTKYMSENEDAKNDER
jgi:hypothetical protein